MRFIRNGDFCAVLLVIVLGFYGWKQIQAVTILAKQRSDIEELARENSAISFLTITGIDIAGRPIDSSQIKKKTIVFLLHDQTLTRDLDFWNQTEQLLAHQADIAIIGYCESRNCTHALLNKTHAFPVRSYGEVVSMEALINADADGRAILCVNGKSATAKISWREEGNSPEKLVREVSQ